ncbi:MAG: PIG-L family deacetylase [Bacteroidota bacterium]
MPFRFLCIFPHPDDESFLMGGTIATMSAAGHDVSLYTLTRGERSRNGNTLKISPEEVAIRRSGEVKEAARILGIKNFYQGNYADGGLRDLDLRILERDVAAKIRDLKPHVLCTFDVQGGSVHPDHITVHHVVKRLFLEMKEECDWLQRLCFCVLPAARIEHWPRKVYGVPEQRIHAVIDVAAVHEIESRALHAHATVYRDVEEHNYDNWMLWEKEYYSFFQETSHLPFDNLFHGLHPD